MKKKVVNASYAVLRRRATQRRCLPLPINPPTLPPLPLLFSKPSIPSSTSHLCLCRFATLSPLRPFSSSSAAAATSSQQQQQQQQQPPLPFSGDIQPETDVIEWEEEDETEPRIGDGGDGGGVVLPNVPWGGRVLSIAHEVLSQFSDDVKMFAFKVSPRGYIYVRLDKLSNDYGCPSVEEIESYSRQYKKRLEEEGSKGDIPDDLALEVSSPGAERLLSVPDDLNRFYDFPMVVSYVENEEAKSEEKTGVFFIDSIEKETEHCVWKLADVKENRDPASKGRPMSRKQRDWRLKLPYTVHRKVTLYLEF